MGSHCDSDALDNIWKQQITKYWNKKLEHENQFHGTNHPLKGANTARNGAHCGQWAFTLTKSPNDGLTEQDLLKAVKKLMAQQSCPIKKYAWYLEHKDGTHHHIHGVYETESGGRIEAKHWKRAWPIWNEKQRLGDGFRGGYHKPVMDNNEYLKYISKDNGVSDSKGF